MSMKFRWIEKKSVPRDSFQRLFLVNIFAMSLAPMIVFSSHKTENTFSDLQIRVLNCSFFLFLSKIWCVFLKEPSELGRFLSTPNVHLN